MKKVCVLMAAVALAAAAFTGCGGKENPKEDFTYQVKTDDDGNKYVAIADCLVSNKKNIVIPSTIDGCPVTHIDDLAFSGYMIDETSSFGAKKVRDTKYESVTLPDTIKFIGLGVFFGCTTLKKVIVPESVKEIEFAGGAFIGCTSLPEPEKEKLKSLGCADRDFIGLNEINDW